MLSSCTQAQGIYVSAALGGKVTLTTASPTDARFPYRGTGTTATITRGSGYAADPMFTVAGNLELGNVVLDGARQSVTADGGITKVPDGGTLGILAGARLWRSVSSGRGAAVLVSRGGTASMSGGSIQDNQSVDAGVGAGVYLEEGSTFRLSGNPGFGGKGTSLSGNIITAGNLAGELIGRENGGVGYTRARQDIYVEGYGSGDATSLVVAGDLGGDPGSIWVWAPDGANAQSITHFKSNEQFATVADGVTLGNAERTFALFRNARCDSDTGNDSEGYLYGVAGEATGRVYWSGAKGERQVILRKTNQSGVSGVGASFTVYRGAVTTGPTAVGKVNGVNVPLDQLESQANGVFFIGSLPYGVYTVAEKRLPTGVTGTTPVFFDVIVDESGVSCTRRV
jgi:hypothetical protein